MKRYLTQREVDRCEQAKEPACKCRCGGAKHGAKRVSAGGDYSSLPSDDPHYRPAMNKAQIIKFLRHVEDYIVSNCYPYGDSSDTAYVSWRDARLAIVKCKLLID